MHIPVDSVQVRALMAMDCPKIVSVGVLSDSMELLRGQRRDNGKWTCPGGHLDPGEELLDGARREAFEEAGISLLDPKVIYCELVPAEKSRSGKPFAVFGVISRQPRCSVTAQFDPDNEFEDFRWAPLFMGDESLKPENSHAKKDCILEYLGLPCSVT